MASPSPSLMRARSAGILKTDELGKRTARSPDYAAECVALRRLARALVSSDLALLQSLADSALQLCGAGSAGICLPEPGNDGTPALRWIATAGLSAAQVGHVVSCDASPSGVTLELGSPQLLAYPQRHFSCLPATVPEAVEELVVPVPGDGGPWGTIWVATHEPGRWFDEEDCRLLESLASFAGAVLNMSRSKDAAIAEAAQAKAARAALQLSDTRKDEFLAMLGHELRNPIAAIDSAIKVSRRLATAQQSTSGMLDIAERQMRQLKRLTDDLLDASRIKQGKVPIVRTHANMQDIVADALAAVASDIEWHGNVLTTSLPDAPVTVYADAARLTQVLTNLLSNAIKYTPRGGTMDLSLQVEPSPMGEADANDEDAGPYDVLVITVKDNGVGIDPAFLPNVLDMFSQYAANAHGGGLGVGLAIVKRMVELHNGTVTVRSDGRGLGTEVQARLPVVCAGLAEVAAQTTGKLAPMRILLVDDNAEGLRALGMLLELDGHEVRLAVSGEDALEIAADFTPDVALIDIGLPGIDGFELARHLRQLPSFAGTRLVALSGYASTADRERGAAAGFDFHLAKPLALEALAQVLARS
ncbi:ATP-binding protein [Cupriavidus sp. 2TAF22]|uniref:hybrid sensor histidine kinase/response regulator n=1 Tax=unclassified Cupriavidus TaxID=2640874 RepID=UPI003F91E81C